MLRYASPPHPRKPLGWGGKVQGDLRQREDRVHCGSMTLVGRPDAAFGDQSTAGKCRFGYVSGLMSSTLKASMSHFAVNLQVRQGNGEEQAGRPHAISEMVNHMLSAKSSLFGSITQ